jgi:hypothetical protein
MNLTIPQQLAALQRLSVKQLQARYVEVFGEATNGHNKAWLVKRIQRTREETGRGTRCDERSANDDSFAEEETR